MMVFSLIASGVGALVGLQQSRQAGKAAERAAGVQADAASAGIEENRRQFDITQGNLQPFIDAGAQSLEQQRALLGLAGPQAQQNLIQSLQDSPAQQFLRNRQERALLRNASAIGGLGGGNVRSDLQKQAAGFASQDLNNQFSRLGQLSGQGQASVGTLGQFGQNQVSSSNQLRNLSAQARATGILGRQQARAQGLNQFFQTGGQILGQF